MTDYAFDNRTPARHGTARSLTETAQQPIRVIPPVKLGHCMLFVSPLCQSFDRYMVRDWSVPVCKRWGWRTGEAPDCLVRVTGDFALRPFRTGDFGRCVVISDCDYGRCAVNSDAQRRILL